VAPHVTHQILDESFLVGFTGVTEHSLKEIVAPEGNECLPLLRPLAHHRALHRLCESVVPHPFRHSAKELERPLHPLQKRLLPLVREGHHEGHLGVTQAQAQDLGEHLASSQHDPALAEIALGVLSRFVRQRDE